jgi:hypothetical protein
LGETQTITRYYRDCFEFRYVPSFKIFYKFQTPGALTDEAGGVFLLSAIVDLQAESLAITLETSVAHRSLCVQWHAFWWPHLTAPLVGGFDQAFDVAHGCLALQTSDFAWKFFSGRVF